MRIRKEVLLVGLIFVFVLALRLYFAFQTPYFSDSESYFSLRQVESITESGFPVFEDELSYNGRDSIFLPLFHYIVSFFALFMPSWIAVKLIVNILASLIVFPVFYFVKYKTKKEGVAIFSSFVSAFIPVFLFNTVNSFSPYALTIPLTIILMLSFLKINQTKDPLIFVSGFIFLLLIDTSSYLLLLAIMLYLVFSWSDNLKIGRSEIELILFSIFVTVFSYLIIFRKVLLVHGPLFIFGNTPDLLFDNFFRNVDIIEALFGIGIIPFLSLFVAAYLYLSRTKKKSVYLPLCFSIVVSVLLLFKLMPMTLGLMYLGTMSVILFGEVFSTILDYYDRMKISYLKLLFYIIFCVLIIITSIIPSIYVLERSSLSLSNDTRINAFSYIKEDMNDNSVVIASPELGHMITHFSGAKVLIDQNYLLIEDVNERFDDMRFIYTSAIGTAAMSRMDKYSVEYIILDDSIRELLNISYISYIDDECFDILYEKGNVSVYKKKCNVISQ